MKEHRFVVCIDNKGYEASLEFGKIYQVVVDKDAEAEGLIRIIDESYRKNTADFLINQNFPMSFFRNFPFNHFAVKRKPRFIKFFSEIQ